MSTPFEPDSLGDRLQEQGVLREMFQIALDSYPQEGCGFVFETAAGQLRVVPAQNQAAKGEEQRRFEADMTSWLVAVRDGEKPLLAFHSHPYGNAEMSALDVRIAVFEDSTTGEMRERHPGLAHMVIAVDGKTRRGRLARMFRFSKAEGSYVCVATFDCA